MGKLLATGLAVVIGLSGCKGPGSNELTVDPLAGLTDSDVCGWVDLPQVEKDLSIKRNGEPLITSEGEKRLSRGVACDWFATDPSITEVDSPDDLVEVNTRIHAFDGDDDMEQKLHVAFERLPYDRVHGLGDLAGYMYASNVRESGMDWSMFVVVVARDDYFVRVIIHVTDIGVPENRLRAIMERVLPPLEEHLDTLEPS